MVTAGSPLANFNAVISCGAIADSVEGFSKRTEGCRFESRRGQNCLLANWRAETCRVCPKGLTMLACPCVHHIHLYTDGNNETHFYCGSYGNPAQRSATTPRKRHKHRRGKDASSYQGRLGVLVFFSAKKGTTSHINYKPL